MNSFKDHFKDHFSDRSDAYLQYRPTYPPALFAWLAETAPGRRRAWDCATGSGQAAVALADHFDAVVATDASARQLAHAMAHPKVAYRVARAEASGLDDASCDLVTVAQAIHWFDLDTFAAEAARVLAPGGAIAAWTYKRLLVDAAVDAVLDELYGPVLGSYWPPERTHVQDGYVRIALPFPEITPPAFTMTARWDLDRLLAYLRTWSSATRCLAATGRDMVAEFAPALAAAWGPDPGPRTITWPFVLRVWRPDA